MAQSISQEAIGATGLPGATAASRHAGATASGAPSSGTFAVGDFIVDQSGATWICSVSGTPGTWVTTTPAATFSGGTLSSDSTYYYRTFLSSGTLTVANTSGVADILIIAGGGSGGNGYGAGGGAGGVLYVPSSSLATGSYTITVGNGGAGQASANTPGNNGQNSSFGSLTAIGGGGGGGISVGSAGGSGGGGSGLSSYAGGAGTSAQGNAGGNGTSAAGGGGGGAGLVGSIPSGTTGGVGGAGTNAFSSWATATGTGVSGYYAGGGGGNGTGGAGAGGAGGGGAALSTTAITVNTGSASGGDSGIAGASGVVIVRYPKTQVNSLPITENVAGKNFVINGGMDIWQRGTSFANLYNTYTADRWQNYSGVTGITLSQVASGLTGFQYALRSQRNSGGTSTGTMYVGQSFESVNSIPFAGKTATFSFYARCGSNFSPTGSQITATLQYGTGTDNNIYSGFTGGTAIVTGATTLTTSWQRFTYTATFASTCTQIGLYFASVPTGTAGANDYFDITGVQLEIAPQATPFSRAGGSIGGELALCYRYYYRTTAYNQTTGSGYGFSYLSTPNTAANAGQIYMQPMVPVTMRTNPTALDYNLSNIAVQSGYGRTTITSISIASGSQFFPGVLLASSTNSFTQGQTYVLQDTGSGNGYLGISAEL